MSNLERKKDKDLFGKYIKVPKRRLSKIEKSLLDFDKNSYEGRLERLKFSEKLFSTISGMVGEIELIYLFIEVKLCFVDGHFIATLILAQSFIEKIFHIHFIRIGLETEAKRGLANMIKIARKDKLINEFLLKKVDEIRLKRNPYIHLKAQMNTYSLAQRSLSELQSPIDIIEKDARKALEIMIYVANYKF